MCPTPRIRLSSPILVIRTARRSGAMLSTLAAKIRAIDAALPAYDLYSMDTLVDRSTAQRRFVMSLLPASPWPHCCWPRGSVRRRVAIGSAADTGDRAEDGLGSSPGEAVAMVFRDGMRLAMLGAAIGIAAAAGLTQLLRNLLFEVQPLDPFSFAGAVLTLLVFAALACYLPARRATRVDPLIALRQE